MTLLDHYDGAIAKGELVNDQLQRQVLMTFEQLAQALQRTKTSWFSWRKKSIQGVYLYGGVGIGKTFLMDLFFDNLAIKEKKRFHFHYFMQQVDKQLRELQGIKNPLHVIASSMAKTTMVLCFDEFMVDDVAYAMILAELLQALFNNGITLIATSNISPDNLYAKGVQRARFLPAIAAIKNHCSVIHLPQLQDHRLGRTSTMNTYFYPLSEDTEKKMREQFNRLAPDATWNGEIIIQHRAIAFLACSSTVIWFDFNVICNLPRSQLDYLEIANRFHTLFISNIPVFGEGNTVLALMLIHLVDVIYDRGLMLILSAATIPEELYSQGELLQDFKRTRSRLVEMQSLDYQTRHPRRIIQSSI